MFDKKQVQKAIKEIDENLAALTGPRQAHLALTSDVKLVQAVCMEYFEGKKDVGTNEPIEHIESGDKNS
jgi:hypothetical protein